MRPGVVSNSFLSGFFQSDDPMGYTLGVAVVLHIVFIFGITFSEVEKQASQQVLEITLSQSKSKNAPEEADFLAQSNQEASGTKDEKLELSTDVKADFHDNVIREVQPDPAAMKKAIKAPKRLLTTLGASSFKSREMLNKEGEEFLRAELAELMRQRQTEISSLEAKLAEQKQIYAKRPRKRQLSAEATKEARDARYLDSFRRSVERTGNLYYPEEAKSRQIFGEVRLLVAVRSNGGVDSVRVLKSSGHRVLDDAAVNSVKRAAPFEVFPPELRKDTDILEIIRTWRFEKAGYSSR
ncbi:MAG: energy transducer TonB [Pseudomonadales bacterium]|nr:energy transducer TonB [Pseudomonadales bacterium]